jgi:regulator of replication initiation timing
MLDRLARLRKVLPAMGQELATARREAAKLRIENGRLRDRLHSLEAKSPRNGATARKGSIASGSPSGS